MSAYLKAVVIVSALTLDSRESKVTLLSTYRTKAFTSLKTQLLHSNPRTFGCPASIYCQNYSIFQQNHVQISVFSVIFIDVFISPDLVLSAYLCLSSLEQS